MPDTIARFPNSFEAVASRQARHFIGDELRHFEADVRQAELTMQVAISSLLISQSEDTADKRELAQDYIRDMLVNLLGDRYADIRRRLDDAGGNVVELRFPRLEPEEAA